MVFMMVYLILIQYVMFHTVLLASFLILILWRVCMRDNVHVDVLLAKPCLCDADV